MSGGETSQERAQELRTPEEKKANRKSSRREAAQQPSVSPVIKDKLQDLDVDEVLNLLVETFDQDFLDTLEERLSEHLGPETEKEDLNIPASLRRGLQ